MPSDNAQVLKNSHECCIIHLILLVQSVSCVKLQQVTSVQNKQVWVESGGDGGADTEQVFHLH